MLLCITDHCSPIPEHYRRLLFVPGPLGASGYEQAGGDCVLQKPEAAPILGDGVEATLQELHHEPPTCSDFEGAHQPRVVGVRSLDAFCRMASGGGGTLKQADREIYKTSARMSPRYHPLTVATRCE
jgi:hypothetical protein